MIFERSHNINQNVVDAFLVWGDWELNPRAYEAIMSSDYIILGPGDFYTSIVPNLIVKMNERSITKNSSKNHLYL